MVRIFCFVVAAALLLVSFVGAQSDTPYWRGEYHFTTPMNWINDPNGLIYDPIHQVYHMFSQYNPYGSEPGFVSWAHATSLDLITWTHQRLAILTGKDIAIWSGSAVMDFTNSSGLCRPAVTCLVTVWAGAGLGKQTVNLASSNDSAFNDYVKFAGNPVIDINASNFRDPAAFWYNTTDGSGYWVVVVAHSDQSALMMYRSDNLIQWTFMSQLVGGGAPSYFECPDMFSIEADGSVRWILMVSAGGTGYYWFGDFNGTHFVPQQSPLRLSYGADFYAAIVYKGAPRNRRIIVGWMQNFAYEQSVPTSPFRGTYTIPRTLTLEKVTSTSAPAQQSSYRLHQNPVEELVNYRGQEYSLSKAVSVNSSSSRAAQDIIATFLHFPGSSVLDLEMVVATPSADAEFGFWLRTNDALSEYTAVGVNLTGGAGNVYVDRRHAGVTDFNAAFPRIEFAPLPQETAVERSAIHLRVLLDRASVEVFIQRGAQSMSMQIFPTPNIQNSAAKFWINRGAVEVQRLDIWNMDKEKVSTETQ